MNSMNLTIVIEPSWTLRTNSENPIDIELTDVAQDGFYINDTLKVIMQCQWDSGENNKGLSTSIRKALNWLQQATLDNANLMQNMGTASFRPATHGQWRVSQTRTAASNPENSTMYPL